MAASIPDIGRCPPEVLQMIFSYLHVEDVKSCRLINSHWRGAVQPELDARVRLVLEKRENRTLVADIKTLQIDEFKNVTIVKQIPRTFDNHFRGTLTSLYLKDICFSELNDVRRVCFTVFGSLKELGLLDVRLSKKLKEGTAPMNVNHELVPKVEKLWIKRAYDFDHRKAFDLFVPWNYTELVRNFSESLLEVHLFQGRIEEGRHDLFQTLQEQGVRLHHLTYIDLEEAEIVSFMDYFATLGNELKELAFGAGAIDVFTRCFQDEVEQRLSKFEFLKIEKQDWSLWHGKALVNLKELCMDQKSWSSFDFFTWMPNLQIVEMQHDGFIDSSQLRVSLPQVQTLSLESYRGFPLTAYGMLFPNISTLVLHDTSGIAVTGNSVIETASRAWPQLEHLVMCGDWRDYLAPFVPETEDDLALYGNGVGNENMLEFENLLRFTNLRSFSHNDELSTDVWYGNECARQVFLNMPNLRTVEIRRCAMSDQLIKELQDKLMVFTYSFRC